MLAVCQPVRKSRTVRRARSLVAVAVVLVAVAVSPAAAIDLNAVWPDLNLPGFTFTPFLTERVEYEANIFQTPSRAQDDVIVKTIPGFLVELPFGPHRLDFGARAEILRYADRDRQDTEHYFALGTLKLDFPGGLKAGLKEDFAHTSTPPGSELTGRIDSTTNVLAPGVEYGFAERYALGLDYAWTHVDFERDVNALDRDEHLGGLTGFYRVQPKTDLLLNYSYGIKDFAEDARRDVTRHLVMAGVRGYLTEKLTSTFRLGYESREPDHRGATAYHGLVATGDWVFQPLARTKVVLLTQRTVEESTFATNFWYLSTLVSLSAEHSFTPKLKANGRVFGGTNDYPDKAAKVNSTFHYRHDSLVGVGLGLDYQIQRWLLVGADWLHTDRRSNFENFQYSDDVVAAKVTLSF